MNGKRGRLDSGMKRFDIAIVGCGNVARMHFDAYAAHPDRVRVVAACDPLREHLDAAREKYGFEWGFGSLEEMIEGADWEVGVVCTPTPVREGTVDTLAGAGRHVFVEKPFADSYEEARRMVRRCDEAGVKLAVNQNFRYHYPFDIARRLIAEGRVGNVVSVVHQNLMFRQDAGWRTRTERHALSVMGIHWLDGFRWMLGDEARSISCETRSSPAIDCAGETDASVQIVFERGAMASYVQSLSSPIGRTETLIIGDEGMLRLDHSGAALFDKGGKEPKEQWEVPYSDARKPEATFEDLDLLLTSLEQEDEPPNSGRDNLKTVALLDGAYRSAGEGRPVLLKEGVAV